jgi:hypothetical protein
MKFILSYLLLLSIFFITGCKKNNAVDQTIAVPNGDFELWDAAPSLLTWQTNGCPLCLPPFDTYVVKKVTEASSGQFAAKFIYNGVYTSMATIKFSVPAHPLSLTAYIKSTVSNNDTARIDIDIFSGNNVIDKGSWFETSSNAAYRQVNITITQNATAADSARITITGGKILNTVLFVDAMVLSKNNP